MSAAPQTETGSSVGLMGSTSMPDLSWVSAVGTIGVGPAGEEGGGVSGLFAPSSEDRSVLTCRSAAAFGRY